MCQTTRYPAVYPLRSITTRSIVALSQFISYFGIPWVIQSDQGSNFTSQMFAEVLGQLKVKHNKASAYHAQSQGALERFHQTLKSLMRSYCTELKGDWEEGLPWLMLSAREVVQESTGFSPSELVFAYKVRGPLSVLQDGLKVAEPPVNLIDYVNGFHRRLHLAVKMAGDHLTAVQSKMKRYYDRRTEPQVFCPGDQVLALLPILGSPFQAKFAGPYTVVRQVSEQNYLVDTPDRKKSTQLCHVNLLKAYYARISVPGADVVQEVKPAMLTTVAHMLPASVSVGETGDEEEGDVRGPGDGVLRPRLKNSETLADLGGLFCHLSEEQGRDLSGLLAAFPSLFSDTPSCTHLVQHDIDVGDAKPIRQRFYRVPLEKRRRMDAEVQYLLDNELAVPSNSSWASPCLLVGKSDMTDRFCTDYRRVNEVTKPDSFPLPRMEDCVDAVGSARFVSKFDLLKGYWQVPLTPRAQEIAAFITSSGLYSYRVMSFGLRNAPATFQRLMNQVVAGLEGIAVYLDDVVEYSDTWEQHRDRVHALLVRLQDANLTVNVAKCEFARATVTYLGKVVGQ